MKRTKKAAPYKVGQRERGLLDQLELLKRKHEVFGPGEFAMKHAGFSFPNAIQRYRLLRYELHLWAHENDHESVQGVPIPEKPNVGLTEHDFEILQEERARADARVSALRDEIDELKRLIKEHEARNLKLKNVTSTLIHHYATSSSAKAKEIERLVGWAEKEVEGTTTDVLSISKRRS